jgi:hypothetical protein
MNVKKYKLNILLKLALIFSIIFGVVNSVSAQDSDAEKIHIEEINLDLPIFITSLSFFIFWCFDKKQQQSKFDELKKHQTDIISKLNQFNDINSKLNNLDKINRQIIEKIQENNQKSIDSEVRLRELISKQQFNQSVNYHNSLTSDISHFNSTAIVDKISQLVATYNQDKTSLSNEAIATVAETQESLNQKRLGNNDTVTLENTSQKKYCIIEEDNDYYLIPHAKIKIDEYNIKTLESLFDCIHFTSEYSSFQLVKPAKVSSLDSELWQLEEKGKLEFS